MNDQCRRPSFALGLHELALIWDMGMREFTPRLPHQPIFYRVFNAGYARQIARDRNTRDANSGFAGFVTEFAFDNAQIAKFADAYGLKGKDATTQLSTLAKTWDYSTSDVACEISANRKSVYLNCLCWAHHDFSESDASRQQRADFISNLKKLWEFNHVDVPSPGEFSENATRS